MRNSTIPKTLQKWIDANPEKVEDTYMENDGYGDESHPYSFWLHLTDEYFCPAMECRTIHEVTVREAMYVLDTVITVREYIDREAEKGRPITPEVARYLGIDPSLL